jgi:hypothetical protein
MAVQSIKERERTDFGDGGSDYASAHTTANEYACERPIDQARERVVGVVP